MRDEIEVSQADRDAAASIMIGNGAANGQIFTCKFCGLPSTVDPSDQTMPVDYCHRADHTDALAREG